MISSWYVDPQTSSFPVRKMIYLGINEGQITKKYLYEIPGYLKSLVILDRFPGIPEGNPRIPDEIPGFLWYSLDSYGISWNAMGFLGFLWVIWDTHWVSRIPDGIF